MVPKGVSGWKTEVSFFVFFWGGMGMGVDFFLGGKCWRQHVVCVFFWGVVGIFALFFGGCKYGIHTQVYFFTNENKNLFSETQLVITVLCPV